jgi:CheY-like chemotaxis protein
MMARVRLGPGAPPATWPFKAGFSILIADSDDEFRRLVRRHLGRAVLVVGDVGDADEAVRLAERLHPDVVLMDIAMPEMGGPEAARRIKADRAETKVVLLTSAEDQRTRRDTQGSGAPAPLLHADAVLKKENVRVGILSQIGRIARAVPKPRSSAGREAGTVSARRRRSRR